MALHLVLWLHQTAGIWQPVLSVLALTSVSGLFAWQMYRWVVHWRTRMHCRPGLREWLREWGAPGGLILAGLLLLLSPGWQWLDSRLGGTELHTSVASGPGSRAVPYRGPAGAGMGIPATLCWREDGGKACR
ncbi:MULTISPECIES: hypothetical protein [Enterobacter]|uniref:hypothetical protein n=1 Tax=Enterobacter TaxID=547 RepID=UPI0007AE0B04|nr:MULTISPECIES: hypothetical protein [Enterobacter]AMZ77766.1 hypothetical protein A4308_12460 [Enterobacter sp. ODB01]EKS6337594.1 hypothetical protein [Enterobacter hormaechei]VAL43408.1 Uncharacterised protein [Enterobacter kobei]